MTDLQIEVLGWVAVIFVTASAALWIANAVFGIVKDPDARKNLNRGVGGTMLGGLAAGVGALLASPGGAPDPRSSPTATATPQKEPPASPAPTIDPPTPEQPEQRVAPQPDTALALPPRPFLEDPPSKNYPPCVARLRQDAGKGGIDRQAAQTCYDQLQAYNSITLLPHEERRRIYISAVEARAKSEPDEARWKFLVEEFASFTYGTQWEKYQTISNVFACDKHLLINLKDFGFVGERAGCPHPARPPEAP